jgi:hypothetical protein
MGERDEGGSVMSKLSWYDDQVTYALECVIEGYYLGNLGKRIDDKDLLLGLGYCVAKRWIERTSTDTYVITPAGLGEYDWRLATIGSAYAHEQL